ncbi:MAG: tetratricopeptide repeat protein [Kofleriaceae bacterium]|nr:tetratricopeptide repeat protein [Kofleriaceae bacterium]
MPGSLFDDIPLPLAAGGATLEGAAGRSSFGADLDGLDLAAPGASLPMGPVATPAASNVGAAGAPKASAPMLDLGESSPSLEIGDNNPNYGDLDLPMPSTVSSPAMAERAAVKFTPQAKAGAAAPPALDLSIGVGSSGKDLSLDLEGESERPRERAKPAAKPAAKVKDKVVDDAEVREKKKLSPRTVKILAAATLGVAAIGAGGFFFYQRHSAAQQRAQSINDDLTRARKMLAAGDPGHWGRAVSAAKKVLEFDSKNGEALGIVAEASFAGFLEEGTGGTARLAAGKRALGSASEAAVNSSALDRARALQALAGEQPDAALQALQTLSKANPADPTLALYIAWAQLDLHQPKEALQSLTPVVASPLRKAPGLYARGRANFELGNLTEARADFTGVLAIDKDHIGAQVGLAAAAPPTMAAQREADVMSILQRKDIDQADARAVVAAWTLAGDDARRAGRFDAARDRYRKALTLAAADLSAQVGLAETELQDNKIELAAELVDKVLALDPEHVVANVLAAEISLKRNKLDDASKKIAVLMARTPPVTNPHQLARIQTLSGLLLEAQGHDDDALARLNDAVTTAGDRDLSPTIATVKLLGKMAQKAQAANNPTRAAELHARADQALAPLVSRAAVESELTVIIGASYLNAGDAAKAEEWLRKAVTTRPNDVEAYFHLAEALRRLQREGEAIEALRKAFDLDPTRTDVGVQLARTYEGLARNDDATQMYDKLLANKEASIELRSRAGRFFARLGQIEKAVVQGTEILKVDPENNAAGFYLRGEGELNAGRLDDARRSFVHAVELERDAQYLDAHGRAAEQLAQKIGDTKYDEEALRAYSAASELAPTMYNPLAGQGRIYVKRHEAVKALGPLLAANKLNPQDAEVMYGIGVSYQEQNQITAAIAWLARSTTAKATADSANRLGRLYLDTDQAGSAAMALTEAVRLGKEKEKALNIQVPWLTESLYFLGRVESDRRNVGGAKRAWEDFLGRNPPNPTQVDEVKRYLANPH